MDELMKIFETIDNLDEDKNIKNCYKEILLFEFNRKDEINYSYKKVYEKFINKFVEEL